MPSKKLLCIDAGGTFFKYGVYTPDGVCVSGIRETPSHSDGSKEEVLAVYRKLIKEISAEYPISVIGISTPGPFYYPSGTYKMKHKFQSLYDVSLIAELGDITDAEWFFSSDTNSFLLGEYTAEISGQYRNVLGKTKRQTAFYAGFRLWSQLRSLPEESGLTLISTTLPQCRLLLLLNRRLRHKSCSKTAAV